MKLYGCTTMSLAARMLWLMASLRAQQGCQGSSLTTDKSVTITEVRVKLAQCISKLCNPSDINWFAMRHHMGSPSPGRLSAAISQRPYVCIMLAMLSSRRSPVGLDELLGEPVVEGFQQVGPQARAGAARNGVAQHKALQAVAVARLPICARHAFTL